MTVILMGPAGSGKTTVGLALAAATGWRFVDGDELHSSASVEKIRTGTPLTDADRTPWLARLRATIEDATRAGAHLLVACSALRKQYRRTLVEGLPHVHWVYLAASAEELRRRLEHRVGHFAGVAILDDQLRVLEAPDDALVIATERPVALAVQEICAALRLPCRPAGDTS